MEKFLNKALGLILIFLMILLVSSFTNKIYAGTSIDSLSKGDKIKFTGTSWYVYKSKTAAENRDKTNNFYLSNGDICTIKEIYKTSKGNIIRFDSSKIANGYLRYDSSYFTKTSSGTTNKTTNKTSNTTKYTLTYSANGGSNAPAKVTVEKGKTVTITSSKPTRSGYKFLYWSTQADTRARSTVIYKSGSKIKIDKNTTLYAIWEKNSTTTKTETKNEYRVHFNKNTNDSVSGMPSPISVVTASSVSKKIPTNKPTRTGYKFLGWATSSSAKKATYAPGDTIKVNKTITLYAVWEKKTTKTETKNEYRVHFNKNTNDSVSGMPSPMSVVTASYVNKKIPTNKPTRSGYKFLGWATSSSAKKATYAPGDTIKVNKTITLYAVWEKNSTTTKTKYTLTYNPNRGSGAPAKVTVESGKSIKISSTKPTRSGYTFLGWAKTSSAKSATYKAGDSIKITSNTTLYAVWKKNPKNEYRIHFNKNTNDNVGNMPSTISTTGTGTVSKTIPKNLPKRNGYIFRYWSTQADTRARSTVTYKPGDTIKINKSITLYAIWEKIIYVETIKFNKAKIEVEIGNKVQLVPTVLPSNATNLKLKWTSSDESIVKVDQKGNLTLKKNGTATITATSTDGSGKTAKCTVVVKGSGFIFPIKGYTMEGIKKKRI